MDGVDYWHCPAESSKTGKAFCVYLTPLMRSILDKAKTAQNGCGFAQPEEGLAGSRTWTRAME